MTQGKPMEDEETATARYIAGNISTQPMLKSDEPDKSGESQDQAVGAGR
jgi:hypothetical protein